MLNVNQVLQQGRYRIIGDFAQNRLGGGYKAYDTVLETNVVLKETRLDRANGSAEPDGLRSAFANEVKNLTGLKHKSLAEVHNYFAEVDGEYLVAEHIDGDFLSELFENGSDAFAIAKAAAVADQLLDALDYLHTRVPPIIHRGIKPQEIKLSADGNVKLFIFGIAENSGANSRIAFSNPAFAAPNLRYLSFEQIWEGLDATSQKVIGNSYDESSQQILEQPADERSDIYSLAATLYQLMTARPPVDALERSIEMLEGKPDPLPSPAEINPEISGEVSAVLMKALEIRRENRFSSAAVMRRVLQTAFAQTKVPEVVQPIEADDDDVLEIAFAVQPAIKNVTENAGQIELMKERLRKAEDQRILAEQRAAEAEKRLLEKEAEHPAQNPPPVEIALPAQALSETQVSTRPVQNEMTKKVLLKTSKPDELKDLFVEPKKENKFARRAALGLAIFVILGGAGWGVWAFLQSRQAAENKTVFIDEQKNSPVQATIPASQPSPEAIPLVEASPSPESVETLASSPATKSKPAIQSSQTPVKKPAAAAKTPAPKKNVTVDDLINDN